MESLWLNRNVGRFTNNIYTFITIDNNYNLASGKANKNVEYQRQHQVIHLISKSLNESCIEGCKDCGEPLGLRHGQNCSHLQQPNRQQHGHHKGCGSLY